MNRAIARTVAATALVGAMLPLAAGPAAALESHYQITPADPYWFTWGASGTGSVAFVNGPAVPPLGSGSVKLATGNSATGQAQIAADYDGAQLDMLWRLTYDTYLPVGTTALPPKLQIDVDIDANGTKDVTWTFDPADQPAQDPALGEWQTWDVFNGVIKTSEGTEAPMIGLLQHAPDAEIFGATGLRIVAGPNAQPVESYVDNFTEFFADNGAVYDFEPGAVPTTPTVRDLKTQVLTALNAVAPTGNRDTTQRIGDAITALERALGRQNWTDGDHIDGKKADKIFDDEEQAVRALAGIKVKAPADTQTWISTLVKADRQLAQVAADDATANGDTKGADKAQRELAKGDDEATKGHAEQAINHYQNAWRQVGK